MTRSTDNQIADIRAFWKSRSSLGATACTQDLGLKQLEIEAIAAHVQDGQRVLDVGCGNGITAMELARRFAIDLTAVDYAQELIGSAQDALKLNAAELKGSVRFCVGDLRCLEGLKDSFDRVYTERALINLPDWDSQQEAIRGILGRLSSGGLYIMCEHSQQGLDRLNQMRLRVGLSAITPPWHNRYLNEAEVESARFQSAKLEAVLDFSSTYYFLSRVVNAWLSAQEGREPSYDAPVNQLAVQLPSFGDVGQAKVWLWRKS
ncbi:MAG: class I SAM-dependent methyltransferase [Deltaproteobacteria bacterium]|nr:class I SAM-dependent methyltransferase [Deltaproteobacteria bacterium]